MRMLKALGSGLIGAAALTVIHETTRRFLDDAPRMDVLGMRAIAKSLRAVGQEPPVPLHEVALAGDLAANSLYYSLVAVGSPRTALARGALLGAAAGAGAIVLPGPLGLGSLPYLRTPATRAMTVAWYTLGGLAAGAAFQLLGDEKPEQTPRARPALS